MHSGKKVGKNPFSKSRFISIFLFNLVFFIPRNIMPRADCDAPCFEQLKATHLRASSKTTGYVRCVASAD